VAGLSITLNASELSRLGSIVWSDSRDVVGRGGSWLRARRSRGGEEDDADRDAEGEDETSVAVLWKGTELGWGTSMVEEPEEEGPTEAGLGLSVALAAVSPSFALPFGSVTVGFDCCGVGADGTRGRDGPVSSDSSCSGWSCSILVGSLAFRRRGSKVHRLCVFETVPRSPWLGAVRWEFK
jgi:hypothetical protein